MALVPEDRKTQGLILPLPVRRERHAADAAAMSRAAASSRRRRSRPRRLAMRDRLAIRMASPDVPVRFLSGGNQQKVAIAKWLLTDAAVYLLYDPTRGIDVGAKQEIYELMRRLASGGARHPLLLDRSRRDRRSLRPGAGHVRGRDRPRAARRGVDGGKSGQRRRRSGGAGVGVSRSRGVEESTESRTETGRRRGDACVARHRRRACLPALRDVLMATVSAIGGATPPASSGPHRATAPVRGAQWAGALRLGAADRHRHRLHRWSCRSSARASSARCSTRG